MIVKVHPAANLVHDKELQTLASAVIDGAPLNGTQRQ